MNLQVINFIFHFPTDLRTNLFRNVENGKQKKTRQIDIFCVLTMLKAKATCILSTRMLRRSVHATCTKSWKCFPAAESRLVQSMKDFKRFLQSMACKVCFFFYLE